MREEVNLLRFRDTSSPVRFSDGLVASFHSLDANVVITSPNSKVIYEPPLGSTRSLVRREDGFYGDDDYVQWPQPWNNKYSHYCAIPVNPREDRNSRYESDTSMWYPISDFDVEFEGQQLYKTYPTTPGTVIPRILDNLKNSIHRLHERLPEFRRRFSHKEGVLKLADVYLSIIDVCLLALEVARPIRDLRRAVSEIQRAWLSCVALIDFMDIYNPRLSIYAMFGRDADKIMGASTDDADVARSLFSAGIPVYFMRHIQDIGSANILSVERSITGRGKICHRDANPPYSMIYMGPAQTNAKFDAILHQSRTAFTENSILSRAVHYEGEYKSSWTLGMSLSGVHDVSSTKNTLGPSRNGQRNPHSRIAPFNRGERGKTDKKLTLHSDIPWHRTPESPYSPRPLSMWINEIQSVDGRSPHRHHPGPSPTRRLIVPPPHLFIKPDASLRPQLMAQWMFFREAWFRRCEGDENRLEPVAIATWKELLSYAVHGNPWDASKVPNTRMGQSREAAWKLLKYTIDNFSNHSPSMYISNSTELPDPSALRITLWQLTEVNFRYEVMYLDERSDTSKPTAESYSHFSEYQLALTKHANHRKRLADNIFNRPALFDIDAKDANLGLAGGEVLDRLQHTHALWILMSSWHGAKPLGWNTGSSGLTTNTEETFTWEKNVIRYYLQTGYNVFGYVPCLPHHLK